MEKELQIILGELDAVDDRAARQDRSSLSEQPGVHELAPSEEPGEAEQEDELKALDDEIHELRVALLRLGSAAELRFNNEKLKRFIPTAAQMPFFENADKRRRAAFCGNRFGKSTIGTVEDCSWLLGERIFFPKDHPLRRLGIPTEGVKLLVLCEDYDKIHDIFTNNTSSDRPGKFFEYLPEENIKNYSKNQKGVINFIIVTNVVDGKVRESTITFDTVSAYRLNPRSFESSDWDAIHVDEPIVQDLWTAVSRGLIDRGGFGWWLLTPLGFPWMYHVMLDGVKRMPEVFFMMEGSIDDNPTLNEAEKNLYLSTLAPDELECRKNGKPLAYGRRVYGLFDETRHVCYDKPPDWVDRYTPPPHYTCGIAIDTHAQTPQTVLFVAIAPNRDVYFYDEIFEKMLIKELALKVVEKIAKVRCMYQICDPSAWNENPDTGLCWAYTLNEYGLDVVKASKSKTDGIKETQQIWANDPKRKVYVMSHMTNFLREIGNYCFDKENKPMDKNDHLMECLYRLVVHDNLRYINPILPGDYYQARDEFGVIESIGQQDRIDKI